MKVINLKYLSFKFSLKILFLVGNSCPNIGACDLGCQYGYTKTHSGCIICECFDPCENIRCPSDSVCGVDDSKAVCRPSNSN